MWKIVIVDDDFQVAGGLRKAIPWEELDAEFAGEAIDGETGLRLVEEVNPDIVLTDIYMPVMNGIQMIEELKKRNFAGRFVILSGYNDFEYARTALRLGVDDYLTKPVTLDQIHTVLHATIEKLEETYLTRIQSNRAASAEAASEQRRKELLLAALNGWRFPEDIPVSILRDRDCRNRVLMMEVQWNERTRSLSLADWNLFKFAVSNIVSEVLGERWPDAVFVWLFGNYSALLLPSGEEESEEETFRNAERLGALIIDHMRTFLGLEIRMGLGRVKHGWNEIKASADEAMQMLLETAQPAAGGGTDLDRYYREIIKALQENRDADAIRLLCLYLDHKKAENGESPIIARMLAAEVWTLLNNAMLMADLQGFRNEDEGRILREFSEMIAEPAKLEEWLETQIHAVRRAQLPPMQEKHLKAVQFMIDYVHKHYADDLTLEQLASQLYISKNYLNQLFKKVTGETFTNYVIRVRIEKAKALLLDGNHLIYEVSEMVGYQNVPYFSTLFKKFCGVSPSEIMKRKV